MNPPTEQLIRDYLNRVSVAARGRRGAEDRRAFLARTRESIEQSTRARGHTDSTGVLKLLSGLGDPVVLVDRERDRLASQRMGAAAAPPGQAVHVPEPAPDVPLTGALQFQTRPITSRWRPGAPMVPKPPRQRRAGIRGGSTAGTACRRSPSCQSSLQSKVNTEKKFAPESSVCA